MNTTKATKATTDASVTGDSVPETLRRQFWTMVRNGDFAGCTRMLKEEEEGRQDATSTSTTGRRIFHMVDKSNIAFRLVNKIDNEDAKALFMLLITLGGKKFVVRDSQFSKGSLYYFGTLLHAACLCNASIDVVSMLVDIGGKELVIEKNKEGCNPLHFAIRNASIDVVSKLVEVGGKEALMQKNGPNEWGINSLQIALSMQNNTSIDVVSKLLEVGGKELAMEKGDKKEGLNSLHFALLFKASIDVVSELIEVGGKELIFAKNTGGLNALHYALECNRASTEIVSKLVEVGGKELVMDKADKATLISFHVACNAGVNALHFACKYNASIDIVSKLIDVGGNKLVTDTDKNGQNPVHMACSRGSFQEGNLLEESLLNLLTQRGGAEALTQKDVWGRTPPQMFIANNVNPDHNWWDQDKLENFCELLRNNASLLLSKGIELQVEGDYGIGGLFSSNCSQKVQDIIYQNWDIVVLPALEQVTILSNHPHLPILQSLIVNKAPPRIIKSTIDRFPKSINTADSFGKYPIDVAVCHGLAWDDGMKEVLEGTAVDIVEREDVLTGLYPFMIVALNRYDFDSVFHLIRSSPKVVQQFDANCEEGQWLNKRQRCA